MSNKKNKGVNLEQQFADKNKNKNKKKKPKRYKDVAGTMGLDPTTSEARFKQIDQIRTSKPGDKIPQEMTQAGVTEPSVGDSLDSFAKFVDPKNPRNVMPTMEGQVLGRRMNIGQQYNTKNMERATAKEDALNRAGGGRIKYGHGGRGIGITKKGVKPCKMR